jgi:hypothetical protein
MQYCERIVSEYVAQLVKVLLVHWTDNEVRARITTRFFYCFFDLVSETISWQARALTILMTVAETADYPIEFCRKILGRIARYDNFVVYSRTLIERSFLRRMDGS